MQGSQMLPDISSGRDKIRRFDESPKLGPQNDQETMSVKESSVGGVAIPEATQSDLNVTNQGLSKDKLLVLKVASDNMISPDSRTYKDFE